MAALVLGAGAACAAPPAPIASPAESRSPPLTFSFPPDGEHVISSETTRGRVTLLAFITTYDMVSQLVVRRASEVIVTFTPRVNGAAIVLEAPRYAELLPAYRESLSLPFPVVMADFTTQQGQGPFGDIQKVPTVLILDREGRQVWRHQGPLEAEAIEAALRAASQR